MSKSADFYPLFGILSGAAARKKGMHFGAKVWIFMPFLGVLGETAARKKGMHFGGKVWISMPFWASWGRVQH